VTRSRPAVARLVLTLGVLLAAYILVGTHSLGDVEVYRAGGRAALSGRDLYAFRIGVDGFTYPPFAAMVFAVVAWLPVPVVWVLMTAVSVPALIVVVRLSAPGLVARFRQGDVPAAVMLAALVLAQPVTATLRWGQVDLVLAALVLADLLVVRRGFLVGIAMAVKLTPGLFIVYLLLMGRRREACTAAATFAGTVALGWCVLPAASARFWLHEIVAGSGVGGFDHPNNQSIRGVCEQLFGPAAGTAGWMLLVPPVLVMGLALARRVANLGHDVISIGIVGVTMCLVSPVSWTHHWVWVVPLLAGCSQVPRVGRVARNAGYALVVLWTFVHPERIEIGAMRPLDTGYVLVALAAGLVTSVRAFVPASRTGDQDWTAGINERATERARP
jgi:alpha-1,2-mannosyltransferase